MSPLCIDHLESGGMIATYHCPSHCGHCLYQAGPHRSPAYIDEATTERLVQGVLRLGCPAVHIGGGEPFVDLDGLERVVRQARARGLRIDYVETNASWYTDEASACRALERLKEAGLGTLLVSISPFHNAYIPFRQVKGVLAACRQVGLTPFPWVMDFYQDLASLDENEVHSLEEFEEAHGPNYLRRIPARYWIHLGGRSLETFGRVFERHEHEAILAQATGGCAELRRTEHFHVDLYGGYVPGLCAGLAVAFEDLGQPLDPERYPLLTRLHAEGVGGLFAWARDHHGFEPRRRGYLSKCDLCDDIRHHLVGPAGVESPELQPRGFYDAL